MQKMQKIYPQYAYIIGTHLYTSNVDCKKFFVVILFFFKFFCGSSSNLHEVVDDFSN